MTENDPDQATGIALTEEVSRRAAAELTVGPAAPRPWDRRRCLPVRTGESWTSVTARLGLPAGRAGEVRTVAGGNDAPLTGQLGCSPDLPPEPTAPASLINGRYRPAVADLDCDRRDDIVWYGPGGAQDWIWTARPGGFTSTATAVGDDLVPVGGDFDGDGCGDVLWYGRGSRPDSIWYGGATRTVQPIAIPMDHAVPRAGDFDDDGRSDVLLYVPGPDVDVVIYGRASRGGFDLQATPVGGSYVPVVGDVDGNGADDVYWYGVGSAMDQLWLGRPGQRALSGPVPYQSTGRYRPVTGDLDGDPVDEIIWYAPGLAEDRRWDGVVPTPVSSAATVWGDYLPLAGDFDGDGVGDIVWFGPGGTAEAGWKGGPGGVSPLPLSVS